MKKTSEQMLHNINRLLESSCCRFRLMIYNSRDGGILSNGRVLSRKEILKLIKRCNSKYCHGLINDLYGADPDVVSKAEKQMRSNASGVGGKMVSQEARAAQSERCKDAFAKAKELGTKPPLPLFPKKHVPWNKGLTKKTNKSLQKMSRDRTGSGNPSFGKIYTDAEKSTASEKMKDLIYTGLFTPNVMNSLTRKTILFEGKKYRSSWEVIFAYHHKNCQYETLRLRYDLNQKSKIYIVDFVDHENKTIFEIKPKCKMREMKNKAKAVALMAWCEENSYQSRFIDEHEIGILVAKTPDHVISLFSKHTQNQLRKLAK
jgi:hypothetical protein